MFRLAQHLLLSSSAKAGDPVFQRAEFLADRPRRTGSPAFAGDDTDSGDDTECADACARRYVSAAVASSSHSLVALSSRCGRTTRATRA
ncbi:hypothetical protein ABIB82_001006 [Bradyrhizobium sp. i1.8.4]